MELRPLYIHKMFVSCNRPTTNLGKSVLNFTPWQNAHKLAIFYCKLSLRALGFCKFQFHFSLLVTGHCLLQKLVPADHAC